MTRSEFWLEYANNMEYGIFWFVFIGIIYYIIFRKYVYSILDPFALHLVMAVGGYSTVFFMYQFDIINDYYFQSFLFTQLAFISGFLVIKPITIKSILKHQRKNLLAETSSTYFMYYLLFALYIVSQFFTYYINGIPLLMESRLETYSGGSGFGIFGRIIEVSNIVILVVAFYNIFFKNKSNSMFDKVVIFVVVINSILSGSKSAIIYIFFILFFVLFFNFRTANIKIVFFKNKFDKNKWWIILFATIVVLVIINIQVATKFGSDNTMNPLAVLLMRFINTGDVFFLAYPDGFINNAESANPLLALFSSLIGTFRILPWDVLPNSISLQLYQDLYHTDLIEGPNTRHNIFGLFYFGNILSIFFSFLLGYLISYVRNKLYFIVPPSINGMILYILLAINIVVFEADPVMAVSNFVSILIVFFPIYIVARILSFNQKKFKLKRKKNVR